LRGEKLRPNTETDALPDVALFGGESIEITGLSYVNISRFVPTFAETVRTTGLEVP
jgi:hypothetical protein